MPNNKQLYSALYESTRFYLLSCLVVSRRLASTGLWPKGYGGPNNNGTGLSVDVIVTVEKLRYSVTANSELKVKRSTERASDVIPAAATLMAA